MPWASARPCLHPGCGDYAERNGRCEAHAPEAYEFRGTTKERGYDAGWKRFREWFLRRRPVCGDCGRPANEVHHVQKVRDFPELRLVETNCMALCKDCHSRRTARGE